MNGYTKVVGYFVGGLILCVAAFMFAYMPLMHQVVSLTETEKKARVESQVLEQQILAYKTAQSDLSKAENKNLLYSFFITDKNVRTPIEEMERAAKTTGSKYQLKINKDTIETATEEPRRGSAARSAESLKVTKQEELLEVPYTLSIQNTNYQQLVYFFDYLENIPHFTEISKIDLSYTEGSEGASDAITANINGVFLVKKNETQP